MKRLTCIFKLSNFDSRELVENNMSIKEQLEVDLSGLSGDIITNSPFILAQFKRSEVLIDDGLGNVSLATFETYGADPVCMLKCLYSLQSVTPKCVIEEIRRRIKQSNQEAIKWISSTLGLSSEKAYLLRKLRAIEEKN